MCAAGGFLGVRPLMDLADQPEQTAPQTVQLAQGDSRAVWSQTQGASCTAPFVVGEDMSVGGIVMGTFGSMLCCFAVVILAVGLVLWLSRRRRA